jgi:C4-type Zn-finger protein
MDVNTYIIRHIANGANCPQCGQTDPYDDPAINHDFPEITICMSCSACEYQWNEVYALDRVEEAA